MVGHRPLEAGILVRIQVPQLCSGVGVLSPVFLLELGKNHHCAIGVTDDDRDTALVDSGPGTEHRDESTFNFHFEQGIVISISISCPFIIYIYIQYNKAIAVLYCRR